MRQTNNTDHTDFLNNITAADHQNLDSGSLVQIISCPLLLFHSVGHEVRLEVGHRLVDVLPAEPFHVWIKNVSFLLTLLISTITKQCSFKSNYIDIEDPELVTVPGGQYNGHRIVGIVQGVS
jgi:hypothetical protein